MSVTSNLEQMLYNLNNLTSMEDLLSIKQALGPQKALSPYFKHWQFINSKLNFLNLVKDAPYQPFYGIGDCLEFFNKSVKVEYWNGRYTCKYGTFHELFGCPVLETWGEGRKLLNTDLKNFYIHPFSDLSIESLSDHYMDYVSYYLFGYKL